MKGLESKRPKADPELLRQLEEAEKAGGEVQAVFCLRADNVQRGYLLPEETEALAKQLIERVQRKTGEAPVKHNIFRNLGSFVVAASPEFVRKLLEQKEISTAVANRQATSAFIPPQKKRPV